MVSRIAKTASGPDAAISLANSRAASRRSSGLVRRSAQPDGERLGALRLAAGVHQLERALLADDRGQRDRDAEALVEAELGEVAAEAGVGRGDAEVGREREAEAPAHRRALHRGDDRLLRREQGDGLLVEVRGVVHEVRLRSEVGAGAEVLAFRAEHDRPAVGVVVERERPP